MQNMYMMQDKMVIEIQFYQDNGGVRYGIKVFKILF